MQWYAGSPQIGPFYIHKVSKSQKHANKEICFAVLESNEMGLSENPWIQWKKYIGPDETIK
jgi:hypothetical protein